MMVRCERLVRWQVALLGEIDDEKDKVSEIDYNEVCEAGQAEE